MSVRAIYIPLCKKISSVPGLSLRTLLSVSPLSFSPLPSPSFREFLPSFLSVEAALEPPVYRYPRVCNANSHQADVLANCPCFYRARIFLRPRRDASRRDASAGQTKRSEAQFRKDAAKDPVGFQNTVWSSRKGRNDSFRVFLRDSSCWCRWRSWWLAERKSFVGRMLLFDVSVLIRTPSC